jgi:hypothetical protein
MGDMDDFDLATVIVDAVPHTILTAPGPPQAREGRAQRDRDNLGPLQ